MRSHVLLRGKLGHIDIPFPLLLSFVGTRKFLEKVFLHRMLVLLAADILKVCPP